MAPLKSLKRSRHVGGDGEDEGAASTNSAIRQNGKKRARMSDVGEEQASSSSSGSDSDDAQPARRARRETPPMTQHEINRDAGYEHLAHEEEDDTRATQKLLARRDLIGDNHAAENAIIIEVTMVNFMCHERLHVRLGPLINFIIGENGSGKSTILTAITLCLGGKTSQTNRGGKLSSYIKTGTEQCRLIIKLKNEGIDAYQPETYGSTITVERSFSQSGTSGFKLKNETGRLVSSKKADVDELIEYFQMQIDNPMNVLTQDDARQFLNQATPAMKYTFFVRGVQLEQLDNDYRLLQETCDAMEAKFEGTEDALKLLKRKMQDAMRLAKQVNEQRDQKKKLATLRNQCAWVQVENEERILKEREDRLTQYQATKERQEADVATKDITYQQANDKYERAAESVSKATEALEPYKDAEAVAQANLQDAQSAATRALQEQRTIKLHMRAAQTQMQNFQKDIDAEQKRLDNATGGTHAKMVEDLTRAQQKTEDARLTLDADEQRGIGFEDAIRDAERRLSESKDPVSAKKRQISDCEDKIAALTRDDGGYLAGYDVKFKRLVNLIRDDKGFKEQPIGPIGTHIKLLKPQWSPILERFIGNLLNGFIVTSKFDQERLQGHINRIGLQFAPVIIANHNPIDTRGHEPDEQYDTILRVLSIDNDMVRRQLIIQQAVEQSLLIEKSSDAMRTMYDGPKPARVKQCFALHPQRRGCGIRYAFMEGGSNADQSPVIPLPRQSPRMKTDLGSQLAYQKDTLAFYRQELVKLESNQTQFQQALKMSQQDFTQYKRDLGALKVVFQRAQEAEDRLLEELDKNNVTDGKLEALQGCLKEAEEELKISQNSYGDGDLNRNKANAIATTAKLARDETIAEREAHEHKIKTMSEKLVRIKSARELALAEKNLAIETIQEAVADVELWKKKVETQEARVAQFDDGARGICPRVSIPPGENHESLESKFDALSDAIKRFRDRIGADDDVITENERLAIDTYNKAVRQDGDLRDLLHRLKKSYVKRIEMWRKFQRHISARARINFAYLLSERGFRGKIIFDHKSKLLDLKIEPDETVRSGKGRQTKTLSGGEKSFSSICLLLSLWEAMGAPLRCLDEFDVFMDQVNRDVSTNLIITAARRSVGRQYILITPNAIGGGAERAEDVTIIRLGDPRQRRIDQMINGDDDE